MGLSLGLIVVIVMTLSDEVEEEAADPPREPVSSLLERGWGEEGVECSSFCRACLVTSRLAAPS